MTKNQIPRNLAALFAMEILSGLSRGSYLVCIGWTTLIVTNDVGRVGQVFIVAMLTILLAGPFVGTIVDRHNRKHLVMGAHIGIAVTMAFLGLVWLKQSEPAMTLLFLSVAVINALRLGHNSAHDGLIQSATERSRVTRSVARFRATHLVATAIGTVAAGAIIEKFSPTAGFLFSAATSLVLLIPMAFATSRPNLTTAPGALAFLSDVRGGARIFRNSRSVRLLAILAAVGLPVGQLANAILSSFIRDDLGRGSQDFGIVDSAWPLGGLGAAILLSLGIKALSARNMEYLFALLAGVATVGFSFCTTIPALFILHGLMGAAVWLCRIVIDGRILEISAPENVGRTKIGTEMAFSLSALIMCFSPTLVRLDSTADYFFYWGLFMVVVSALIWGLDRRRGDL